MTAQTCGISIAHGTDETVCVITYFLQVFLLTLIEMGLFAAAVGAGGIMELMEQLCERVEDVLTI